MLRIRYTSLASIQFVHSFYKYGICNDFTLLPTERTRAMLQTYDWVTRSLKAPRLGNSFTLAGREDEPGQPTTPLDETSRFTFLVQLTNPLLPNVSDWGNTNGPFFFSNRSSADGSPKTSLTVAPILSPADMLPPIMGQQFNLSVPKDKYKAITISQLQPDSGLKPTPVLLITEKIGTGSDATTVVKRVATVPIQPGQETLDIRVANPGRYTLTKELTDGSAPEISEVYLNDEVVAGPSFFGILELVFTQTPPAPIGYTITMEHRQKNWQYVLVDAKEKEIPVAVDNAGQTDLKLVYQPPTPNDPAYPASLSTETPIDTEKSLENKQVVFANEAADATKSLAERQAAQANLQGVVSQLALIQTLKADRRVKGVYIAQLPDPLPLINYTSPVLKLQHAGKLYPLPIPTAEMPNTTIFYTI